MNVTITIFDASTAPELNAASAFLCDLADIRSECDSPKDANPAAATGVEPAAPARRTRKPRTAVQPTEAPTEEPAAQPTEAPTAQPAEVAPAGNKDWDDSAAVKTYTEADVQALATLVARAKGPDTVKEKIAELGGARIADLDADKLNQLGAFLETQK